MVFLCWRESLLCLAALQLTVLLALLLMVRQMQRLCQGLLKLTNRTRLLRYALQGRWFNRTPDSVEFAYRS